MPVTLLRFLLQGVSLPRSRIPLGTFYSLAVKRFPPQVLVESTFNRQPLPFGPKAPTQRAPKSSHCRFDRSAELWKAACLSWCRESRSLPLLRGPKTPSDWKGYHASHRRPEDLWRSTLGASPLPAGPKAFEVRPGSRSLSDCPKALGRGCGRLGLPEIPKDPRLTLAACPLLRSPASR
jgi:hypothetical protein